MKNTAISYLSKLEIIIVHLYCILTFGLINLGYYLYYILPQIEQKKEYTDIEQLQAYILLILLYWGVSYLIQLIEQEKITGPDITFYEYISLILLCSYIVSIILNTEHTGLFDKNSTKYYFPLVTLIIGFAIPLNYPQDKELAFHTHENVKKLCDQICVFLNFSSKCSSIDRSIAKIKIKKLICGCWHYLCRLITIVRCCIKSKAKRILFTVLAFWLPFFPSQKELYFRIVLAIVVCIVLFRLICLIVHKMRRV